MSTLRDLLSKLSPTAIARLLAGLSADELLALRYDWATWARPEQIPPDDDPSWSTFLYLAGRGAGKTRSAAEWVRRVAREHPGCRIAVVARTAADARDVCVEGESGLLAVHPTSEAPLYEPSKRRLTWRSGTQATIYSADEPDLLRGPQHHFAWADELATWQRLEETWSNLRLGLRLGQHPRCVVTTTPRPLPLLRELLKSPTTLVRRGSTFDNAANLAPSALAEFRAKYEGTRLGRQELFAEVLEDVEGALWSHELLDRTRVKAAPELVRIVVGVDPSVSAGARADEAGIIVASQGADGHFYIIADASGRMSPDAWARAAVRAYHAHHADRLVCEVNNGGDLVELTVRTVDPNVPIRKVHAAHAKIARAEPCAALWEQGRAHVVGSLRQLEDEFTSFTGAPGEASPNRLDAAVWALHELMADPIGAGWLKAAKIAAEQRTAVRAPPAANGWLRQIHAGTPGKLPGTSSSQPAQSGLRPGLQPPAPPSPPWRRRP